jgi:hypothetical protein
MIANVQISVLLLSRPQPGGFYTKSGRTEMAERTSQTKASSTFASTGKTSTRLDSLFCESFSSCAVGYVGG